MVTEHTTLEIPAQLHAPNLIPRPGCALVVADTAPTQTDAGVVIPNNATEAMCTGTVVKVGGGGMNMFGQPTEVTLEPGQRILWDRNSQSNVKAVHDGVEYLLMDDTDYVAILPDRVEIL